MPTCAPMPAASPPDAAARQLLGEDGVVEVVAALPAVLLGVLQAEEAHRRELGEDLVGEPARLLPLGRVGAKLVGDEAPDRVAQRLVLVGEGRVGGHRPRDRIARPRRARHRERMASTVAPGCPVHSEFDPLSPRYLEDPFAVMRELPAGEVPGLLRAGDRLLRRHPLRGHRGDLPRPRDVLGGRRAAAARRAERGGRRGPAGRRPPPGALDGQPRPARRTRACAATPRAPSRRGAWPRWRTPSAPRSRTCSTRSTRRRRSISSRR